MKMKVGWFLSGRVYEKGLERTATVDVVSNNETAQTDASGKVTVGDVETGMDDDIEGSEMDGGLGGSNLGDAEDSGASQNVMEYLHDRGGDECKIMI